MPENEDDKIGKALGLQPIESIKSQISTALSNDNDDVAHARTNIRDLIYKGTSSLEDLLDVARASEHPRAYEVAANFLKTLVDANKELADLKFKEDKVADSKVVDNRSINNFFVGSTTELLKMMKNAKTVEHDDE